LDKITLWIDRLERSSLLGWRVAKQVENKAILGGSGLALDILLPYEPSSELFVGNILLAAVKHGNGIIRGAARPTACSGSTKGGPYSSALTLIEEIESF
jgi:hypothetical protein